MHHQNLTFIRESSKKLLTIKMRKIFVMFTIIALVVVVKINKYIIPLISFILRYDI